jgi:very-short-patch-repair endonuclease
MDARADRAPVAAAAYPLLQPLREQGLGDIVDDLARRGVTAERVAAEVRFVHRASVLTHLRSDDVPQQVPAEAVREAERAFRRADRAHLQRNAARARRAVLRRLTRTLGTHASQVTAWRRALEATRVGGVDVRDVVSRAPDVVLAAQPVVLASPLVVPSVLPPDMTFDLVVVDRAGRTTTARTVPALARGRQVVVVGDSGGQAPAPFSVVADPRAESELEGAQREGSSLLDDAAAVLPVRHLQTHYRALDQGLVAPLAALMPEPVHSFPGVWRSPAVREHVAEGAVQVGVEKAVQLALAHARRSVGESLLLVADDDAAAEDLTVALRAAAGQGSAAPAAEALAALRDERTVEPLLVRPVSRIAGEVRDRVVWLTGPAAAEDARAAGAVLSAARRSVDLVTPVAATDWPSGPGADLVRRAVAFREQPGRGSRSAVLGELVRRLRAEGLELQEGLGHGPHAVDVAVAQQGDTRWAVAVDGDVHRGAVEAEPGRDLIRLRHEQLTRLGWTPLRVRSTDVFTDPAREVARVLQALRDAESRAR